MDLKVGQRIRFFEGGNTYFDNQLGIIIERVANSTATPTPNEYAVRFDLVIHGHQEWLCHKGKCQAISPEEEAAYQEQLRREEEQRLDQQRREEFAARYL